MRRYDLYGLRVASAMPLPGRRRPARGPVDLALVRGSPAFFARVARAAGAAQPEAGWFRHVRLADGSQYLRWAGLFEFLIAADGRRIACRPLEGASPEALQTYALGHVLSFALLARRIESLHATTVVVRGQAVAFLGDCGRGKSTLGAAFVRAGHPLLTDDLLVLTETARGFAAFPGPPRIKLFPEAAALLPEPATDGHRMNPLTAKRVIPLAARHARRAPAPLRAFYVLRPTARRRARIGLRPLGPRAAFVELLRHTFNPVVVDPERLRRQFWLTRELASRVPVTALSFPRGLGRLPAVRRAIEAHLAS